MTKTTLTVASLILTLIATPAYSGEIDKLIAKYGVGETLRLACDKLNESTPLRVDNLTMLDAVSAYGKTANLRHTIDIPAGARVSDIQRWFEEEGEQDLINGICTDPTPRALIDNGATYKYSFAATDGEHIIHIFVDKHDCI